jgi:NTP pyrophosphatase (non-canonical NTP hydrolase)
VDLNDYQREAKRTAPRELSAYPPCVRAAVEAMRRDPHHDPAEVAELLKTFDQLIWGLGLAGEVGETLDMLKKHFGHGHALDRSKLKKEFGDVRWYGAVLEDSFGFTSDDVAQANVAKLRARYPEGFSVEASKAKADEKPTVTPDDVARWSDDDAAYQRVFGEPRKAVEKTLIPEECTGAKRGVLVLECDTAKPCALHKCNDVECHCL